jgi:hypothetical protein
MAALHVPQIPHGILQPVAFRRATCAVSFSFFHPAFKLGYAIPQP